MGEVNQWNPVQIRQRIYPQTYKKMAMKVTDIKHWYYNVFAL